MRMNVLKISQVLTHSVKREQYHFRGARDISYRSLKQRGPVNPVGILPDRGPEDEIVHIPLPRGLPSSEVDLFSSNTKSGKVIALGSENLE